MTSNTVTDLSKQISIQSPQHAYVITGDRSHVFEAVTELLDNQWCVKTRGNPDFFEIETDTLLVEQVQNEIVDRHAGRSYAKGRRVFVIKADGINRNAQNALLKILEEPHPDTYFFILLPYADTLLDTFRSRVVEINLSDKTHHSHKEARDFLTRSTAERLSFISEIIDSGERRRAVAFLDMLETEIRGKSTPVNMSKSDIFTLEEVLRGKDYLRDSSSSIKLILQHIALVCGRGKS